MRLPVSCLPSPAQPAHSFRDCLHIPQGSSSPSGLPPSAVAPTVLPVSQELRNPGQPEQRLPCEPACDLGHNGCHQAPFCATGFPSIRRRGLLWSPAPVILHPRWHAPWPWPPSNTPVLLAVFLAISPLAFDGRQTFWVSATLKSSQCSLRTGL